MNARKFFQTYQRDGRAFLRGTGDDRPKGRYTPDLWLINAHGSLVLCADILEPALRFVDDREEVKLKTSTGELVLRRAA